MSVFGSWLWNSDLDIGIASEVDMGDALSGYSFIKSTVFWVLGFTLLLTVGAVLLVLAFGERTHRVLNKARIDLEKKVLERTAELEKNQERSGWRVDRGLEVPSILPPTLANSRERSQDAT